jgi:hypothetical protein
MTCRCCRQWRIHATEFGILADPTSMRPVLVLMRGPTMVGRYDSHEELVADLERVGAPALEQFG